MRDILFHLCHFKKGSPYRGESDTVIYDLNFIRWLFDLRYRPSRLVSYVFFNKIFS